MSLITTTSQRVSIWGAFAVIAIMLAHEVALGTVFGIAGAVTHRGTDSIGMLTLWSAALAVAFTSMAIGAELISRTPAPFLGLGRIEYPAIAIAGLAGVFALSFLIGAAMETLQIEALRASTKHALMDASADRFALYAVTTLATSFGWELLLRGYVMRRVLFRWGPVMAIAIVGLASGLSQLNLQRMPASVMLGAALSFVAIRSGSVWVTLLGGSAINVIDLYLLRTGADFNYPEANIGFGVLLAASLAVMIFWPRRMAEAEPAPATVRPDRPDSV